MTDAPATSSQIKAKPPRGKRRRRVIDFSTLHPDQNLDEFEVCEFLCMSRSKLRNKLDVNGKYFDPSFPRSGSMCGEARKGSAVRWRAGAVIDWNRAQHEKSGQKVGQLNKASRASDEGVCQDNDREKKA
jgi:predicted DNA-binding transcriptional regulator AlpA